MKFVFVCVCIFVIVYFLSLCVYFVYLYSYLKHFNLFHPAAAHHSSPHHPAFAGKAYHSALTVSRSLYKWILQPHWKGFLGAFPNFYPVFLFCTRRKLCMIIFLSPLSCLFTMLVFQWLDHIIASLWFVAKKIYLKKIKLLQKKNSFLETSEKNEFLIEKFGINSAS